MNFTLPKLDLISFWFGFALATVFWLIILRISKMLPKMKKSITDNRTRQESFKNITREHNIRLLTLRQAEANHLASSLFPLSKILIEPFVLTPPDLIHGLGDDDSQSDLMSILPYTPEVPGLFTDFPAHRTSLVDLSAACQFVCLAGDPGTGKSTALSFLASQLARSETGKLPVILPAPHFLIPEKSASEIIFDFLAANVSGTTRTAIEDIFSQAAANGRLLLIIPNLDEVEKSEFDQVAGRITELVTSFPAIRIFTTTSSYYSGSLEESGFVSCALAPWNKEDRRIFVDLWFNAYLEENKSLSLDEFATLKTRMELSRLWLLQEDPQLSPFDTSIKVWMTFANTLQNSRPGKLYDSYLKFISENLVASEGYFAIAESMKSSASRVITREKLAEILNSRSDFLLRDSTKRVSSMEVVDLLVGNSLFSELPDGSVKFTDLLITAYLESQLQSGFEVSPFKDVLQSSYMQTVLYHQALVDRDRSVFISWLDQNDSPLHRNFLTGLRWLSLTETGQPLRTDIFRQSARLLQDRTLPFGARARFVNSLAKVQDASIFQLMMILKENRDQIVRQLSALGLGMFMDEKAVAALASLSDDEDARVQNMAVLSLGKIWSIPAQDLLVNVIFNADESTRANACEILSLHRPEGHEMLKEIMATDNYLSRKAAISGLIHINEPWVRELLEKASVEDAQWVVRDAAIFALDHLSEAKPVSLENWLPVHENPWTLEKAEEFSMELPGKIFPSTLLQTVLEKGTNHDRKVAMHYLLQQPTPEYIRSLNQITRQEDSSLRDHALNALYSLSRRGLEIK